MTPLPNNTHTHPHLSPAPSFIKIPRATSVCFRACDCTFALSHINFCDTALGLSCSRGKGVRAMWRLAVAFPKSFVGLGINFILSSGHVCAIDRVCVLPSRRTPSHPSCRRRRELVWGVIQLKCALRRRWWSTGTLRFESLSFSVSYTFNDSLFVPTLSIVVPSCFSYFLRISSFHVYPRFNHCDACRICPSGKLSSLPAQRLESLFREWTDQGLQVWQHHHCQGVYKTTGLKWNSWQEIFLPWLIATYLKSDWCESFTCKSTWPFLNSFSMLKSKKKMHHVTFLPKRWQHDSWGGWHLY